MSTQVSAVPGQSVGRTIVPLQIFTNPQTKRIAPSWYFFDGSLARDIGNTPPSLLRMGLLIGVENSTATTPGEFTNSVIDLTTTPVAGNQTTLTISPAGATDLVRRIGTSGTFNLTGEAAPGGTARTVPITYSAVNTTTGVITITAPDVPPVAAADQVNSLVIVDNTGSGNFTLTVGSVTTGNIAYSATAATLVGNINTACNATFGTNAVIASGSTLATVKITLGGQFSDSVTLPVYITGSSLTGVTVNGQVFSGTAATQVAPVSTVGNPPATTAPVYAVNSIPFVDSTGSGTFSITVESVTTGAITYSATAATLVNNINVALQATFGPEIVASGASLAAITLTAAGPAYAPRPLGAITATILTGSTGYTINGSGTVGTPSTCAVTTAGVALVPWAGGSGNFVAGSLVQPTDGTQFPISILSCGTEYGVDVLDSSGNPLNEPIYGYAIGGDVYSASVIPPFASMSAGAQAWVKAQLRANGGTWTFDNDR